ncbi:sterol desaturase family protein [Arundinibacter roseus]|uniref:Sterol desaturase family protein n=1 Tax=Arundinibacter roseus TaxID=2070510 RepID=A0A4R4K8R3_9BACT|nr:sterol desaturase family protein [Arundinibacter roseus]TDB64048.1 sterol desaturase family protein [Arundinibacter roseus]
MEQYAKILTIAMPVFLIAVLSEKLYGWMKFRHSFKHMDMISSLSSGFTNSLKDALGLGISIITYSWMVTNWAFFEIKSTVWVYLIAFIVLDLAGYLGHMLSHKINVLWNRHLIHHSSEEFNLACALRQSISGIINIFTIFLIPAALVGVPAQVIAVVAPLHLFAQFWYHTTYIGRMGFLEKILVTPSHHRVHHAINPQYIDKNHGQIFIIWDKLFGTYQEELPEEPPVYGITRPVSTWNPIKINWGHLWLLMQDAYRCKSWTDKLRIWFMPTGWRPADVEERYPVYKIEDVHNFEKYNQQHSGRVMVWIWCQFLFTFLLIYTLFSNLAQIGFQNAVLCGGFIMLGIYAYTELMDRNPYAWLWEALKNGLGLGILIYMGNWFGISTPGNWLSYFLGAYFLLSSLITFVIVRFEIKKQPARQTEQVVDYSIS